MARGLTVRAPSEAALRAALADHLRAGTPFDAVTVVGPTGDPVTLTHADALAWLAQGGAGCNRATRRRLGLRVRA